MKSRLIDLRSDTVTLPSESMIEAIITAHHEGKLGDDVYREDQVVNELQRTAAELFGKEDALLVTSGTQGNLVSILSQTKPGDEIILEEQSHMIMFESGGISALGGVMVRTVKGDRGYITPSVIENAIRGQDVHQPRRRVLSLENTHNLHGGTILTPQQTITMAKAAHENGLLVHIDGARIFNAAVAQGIEVKALVASVDSVQMCLSKGLAAPVGSIILGTTEFINEARRIRKRVGGGMRQAGIIAAPGLIALTEMPKRLIEDHENAHFLAKQLDLLEGVSVQMPETNIINLWLTKEAKMDAFRLRDRLTNDEIRIMCRNQDRIRLVTHFGITREDIERVVEKAQEYLS